MQPAAHQSRSQLSCIQTLRGVAVLLVVLVHAINVADFRLRDGVEAQAGWLAGLFSLNEFGASGVDLFFVISGFVMAMIVESNSGRSVGGFLRDRMLRVAPLYWIASAVYILPAFLVMADVPLDWVLTAVLILPGEQYIAPPLVVGWSLAFELAFYGIVAVIMTTVAREKRVTTLIVLMSVLAVSGQMLQPLDGLAAILFNPIMVEFAIGLGVHMLWRRGHVRAIALAPWLIGAGIAFLLMSAVGGFDFKTLHMYVIRGETGAVRALIWAAPWGMIMLGLLWRSGSAGQERARGNAVLNRIGDASYSIYLVHQFPLDIAERQLPGGFFPPDLVIVGSYAIAVGLGLIVHRTIEKPMMAWFKRLTAEETEKRGQSPVTA